MDKEKIQPAEQFAKDHWKEIFAISGSVVGGAILLLVGYHRHRRTEGDDEEEIEIELKQLEAEATLQVDETSKLLETGIYAVDHIPEVEIIAEELSGGLIGVAKEVMIAIRDMATFKKNRTKDKEKK